MALELPLLTAYDPEKALKLDAAEGEFWWLIKVDGQAVVDDHEGGSIRFPADIGPDELVDAVCPPDGRQHFVEAVLRGGTKGAIRATVQLGAHRRMPPTGPAPMADMPPHLGNPWPSETWRLVPPTSAWDGVLGLARDGQAANSAAQAKEREVHVHLMAQMAQQQQMMFAQQMAVFAQGMGSMERGLQHVASSLGAHGEAAAAAAAAAPAAAHPLELLAQYGPLALGFAKNALSWLGIEPGDLKGLVGGAIAAKGIDPIKAALAENLGAGMLMLMEGGSEWIKARAQPVKRAAQAGRQVAQAAAEAVDAVADAVGGQ